MQGIGHCFKVGYNILIPVHLTQNVRQIVLTFTTKAFIECSVERWTTCTKYYQNNYIAARVTNLLKILICKGVEDFF